MISPAFGGPQDTLSFATLCAGSQITFHADPLSVESLGLRDDYSTLRRRAIEALSYFRN
jgi:hypothetical protein